MSPTNNSTPHNNGTNHWLWWRVASFVFVGTMAAWAIISGWFLYVNVFRTLEDVNTIVLLNPTLGIDILNTALYDDAKQALDRKTTIVTVPAVVRDIFSFASSSSHDTTPSTR